MPSAWCFVGGHRVAERQCLPGCRGSELPSSPKVQLPSFHRGRGTGFLLRIFVSYLCQLQYSSIHGMIFTLQLGKGYILLYSFSWVGGLIGMQAILEEGGVPLPHSALGVSPYAFNYFYFSERILVTLTLTISGMPCQLCLKSCHLRAGLRFVTSSLKRHLGQVLCLLPII